MLQVVSTNLGGNRHSSDDPLNPAEIANRFVDLLPLDKQQPLILGAQELSAVRFAGRNKLDMADKIAAGLGPGFHSMYAPEVCSDIYPHRRAWNNGTYAGMDQASEGNGLITNLSVAKWPWPGASLGHPGYGCLGAIHAWIGQATLYPTGDRNTQPRNVLVVPLHTQVGKVYAMTTHLTTLTSENRSERIFDQNWADASRIRQFEVSQILNVVDQLRQAEMRAGEFPSPIILTGDFNAELDSPEMVLLTGVFDPIARGSLSKLTFTHIKHRLLIDHILVSDPLHKLGKLLYYEVFRDSRIEQLTDHYPVVTAFSL